jgi:hypothetical protein
VDGPAHRGLCAVIIAAVQVEVLSWRQLMKRAGSRASARRWVADGDWRRIFRDAYVARHVPDDADTRVAALRAVLPTDVAVSHRTALWIFGADVGHDLLHVTVPRGRHLEARPGMRPHSALLPADELCLVGGVLVVSPARAVIDVARSDALVEAVVVGDASLRLGVATEAGIAVALDHAAGLRNVERARAVVSHLEPRTESPMESRYRMRLVQGGLPRPQAQFDVYDAAGHAGRGDFHLDGVVLEYDGRQQRLDKGVFVDDRRRQNRIADTGLEIRRFTSYDVYQRPAAAVCAEVLRAVTIAKGRDRSGLRTGPDTLPRPRRRPPETVADFRLTG